MNDCDVQYRQSSNKRLLVELTLIQVGQITQPEDQDVPSAGRTPHRLKSLFQKLIAPLKPASQGAGKEQVDSKKVEAVPAVGHSIAQNPMLMMLPQRKLLLQQATNLREVSNLAVSA